MIRHLYGIIKDTAGQRENNVKISPKVERQKGNIKDSSTCSRMLRLQLGGTAASEDDFYSCQWLRRGKVAIFVSSLFEKESPGGSEAVALLGLF